MDGNNQGQSSRTGLGSGPPYDINQYTGMNGRSTVDVHRSMLVEFLGSNATGE